MFQWSTLFEIYSFDSNTFRYWVWKLGNEQPKGYQKVWGRWIDFKERGSDRDGVDSSHAGKYITEYTFGTI